MCAEDGKVLFIWFFCFLIEFYLNFLFHPCSGFRGSCQSSYVRVRKQFKRKLWKLLVSCSPAIDLSIVNECLFYEFNGKCPIDWLKSIDWRWNGRSRLDNKCVIVYYIGMGWNGNLIPFFFLGDLFSVIKIFIFLIYLLRHLLYNAI